jgi:hypothetical protein
MGGCKNSLSFFVVANLEMAWKMVLKPGLFYKKAVFV